MQSLKYSSCEPGERLRNGTQPALKEDRPNFRIGSHSDLTTPKFDFRGRDASYLAPPAQIRTGPIRAYGSHLGCLTANLPYALQRL